MISLLSGIQQVGIGVRDADARFTWYRKMFGMDVPVFKDASIAALMLPYTGGEPRKRYAILALNMQGGGGFEIWQYTERQSAMPTFTVEPGDLGIFGVIMKTRDVKKAHAFMQAQGLNPSPLFEDPVQGERFFVTDPDGNRFTFTRGESWFGQTSHPNGGVQGVQIGVKNMEASIRFYTRVLGFSKVRADEKKSFAEYGGKEGRRVILQASTPFGGAFSRLLGAAEIELFELSNNAGRKIYDGRFWGDMGFIHVCFDVNNMPELEQHCAREGHPFTVNSGNSFDMGEAAGQFAYTEDPDGTLIEFVQTHKLPLVKKLKWYLDLRKRKPGKPLPDWMLRTMGWQRVKD